MNLFEVWAAVCVDVLCNVCIILVVLTSLVLHLLLSENILFPVEIDRQFPVFLY